MRAHLHLTGIVIVSTFTFLSGCAPKENLQCHTDIKTRTGNNWVETDTVEQCVHKKGRIVEETTAIDCLRCIGPKGKHIKANSIEECVRKGGKVVEEAEVIENSYVR